MPKKNEIKVLMVKPGEKPYVTVIKNDLHAMQEAVDGLIEILPLTQNAVLVCNEEGKINGLPGNRRIENGDIIAGNFFIAGDTGRGDLTDLTARQAAEYENRFGEIEHFEPEQVEDALFMRFTGW